MKIRIERKSLITHQIFEIENQTLISIPHQYGQEIYCVLEKKTLDGILPFEFRVPVEGTLEISAI